MLLPIEPCPVFVRPFPQLVQFSLNLMPSESLI